jgi:hypothetical protein
MGRILTLLLAATFAGLSGAGASSAAPHCLRALASLSRGSIPRSGAFALADCGNTAPQRAFHYDRSLGATRLTRDLSAGDIVAPFPEFGEDMVLPGQPLELVVAIGDVRVARQVVALQEARPGERLFVRSADGEILSVRYEAGVK